MDVGAGAGACVDVDVGVGVGVDVDVGVGVGVGVGRMYLRPYEGVSRRICPRGAAASARCGGRGSGGCGPRSLVECGPTGGRCTSWLPPVPAPARARSCVHDAGGH
ncbi:hypothetical protein EJC51_28840 [Streptomyces aquilus]|uniref:Uncharacterized protein n=1 Tax=Streptomyces aquilus TaxID=2548456 RepID=A0A3Q9C1P0_9ACTN|nr:hypothetical protein EJC51_28840 [Streptomyces aquilus]